MHDTARLKFMSLSVFGLTALMTKVSKSISLLFPKRISPRLKPLKLSMKAPPNAVKRITIKKE